MRRLTLAFAASAMLALAAVAVREIRDVGAVLYDRLVQPVVDFFGVALAYVADGAGISGSREGYDGLAPAGGAPLDPALQNDMRHEAGVPRRAAPRSY